MSPRAAPDDVARKLLADKFPAASACVLAGSVVAGRGTTTSDLDMVVVVEEQEVPRRESLTYGGWPVEVFIHSHDTMRDFFGRDVRQRRPAMLRMWAEGELVLGSDGVGADLQTEARRLLDAGYGTADDAELRKLRYTVTDLLDDLKGDPVGPESAFIAPALATALCHLRLVSAGAWIGTGKWMFREAQALDRGWAERIVLALRAQSGNDADPLIQIANSTLGDLGGRLFDGFAEHWKGI